MPQAAAWILILPPRAGAHLPTFVLPTNLTSRRSMLASKTKENIEEEETREETFTRTQLRKSYENPTNTQPGKFPFFWKASGTPNSWSPYLQRAIWCRESVDQWLRVISPQRTSDKVWRQFWWSQLGWGMGGCHWSSDVKDEGHCYTSYSAWDSPLPDKGCCSPKCQQCPGWENSV